MITYIKTERIFPHPDNPRKNLGDLTELRDSIKENGIFQNLTVIPRDEETFTVIIGHRRLEAAKLAGLESVPCAIAEMDRKTQLSTMLLENMQRADLTVYEQGQGFQMMFELGISVKEIAEKTGFGETTVRKRLTISKLPEQEMKAAEERGGKLEDYVKICEIEDEKKRSKLLEAVGTNNFEYNLNSAIKEQKIKKNMPGIKAELKKFAVKGGDNDRWSGKFDEVMCIEIAQWEPGKATPKAIKEGVKYTWIEYFGRIYIMKPAEKKKKEPIKKSSKEKAANEKRAQLARLAENAFECRKAFILGFSASKRYAFELNKWLLKLIENRAIGSYFQPNNDELKKIVGDTSGWYLSEEKLEEFKINQPEKYKAVLCWCESGDNKKAWYHSPNFGEQAPTHNGNKKLDEIYDFLCQLGYQMSDEEIALQNGTHELFKKVRT